jgi:phospholipid/cholesterol/gamma-HCH transport system substrate-binding protein
MLKIRTEARVGILIFVAVAVLIAGAMFLKGYHPGRSGYLIETKMSNVSGLIEGSPVTIAGLKIGKVQDMEWIHPSVKVKLWIDSRYRLYQGSVVHIKDIGFMGESCIEIQPGKEQDVLGDGDSIQSGSSIGISDLIYESGEMVGQLRGVASVFQSTLDKETRENLRFSIENTRKATDVLQKDLNIILRDLKKVSSQYSEMGTNERDRVKRMLQNLDKSSESLKTTSTKLDSASSSLEVILADIAKGKGTLGKMIKDDSLYVNLKNLTMNLNLLAEDVRKNPKKYLHVSIF